MTVSENLAVIQEKIKKACEKSNRSVEDITIIGVTKYVTIERAEELIAAGVHDLGENRTEEFLDKHHAIEDKAKWHFIGTLQSRKVKDVIGKVAAIHSLERTSVAKQINNRSEVPIDCFIQVNVSSEETKHGLSKEQVIPFIQELQQFEKVNVVGLMTMAPHIEDKDEIRQVFRKLAELRNEVQAENMPHAPCKFLSMGMSNDFDIAIEEGATHIRIGSQLVGS